MNNTYIDLAKVIAKYFGADAAYLDIDCFTLAKQIMKAGWINPVRCKDCYYGEMCTPLSGGPDRLCCHLGTSEENPVVRSVDENHFCGYGKTRGDD